MPNPFWEELLLHKSYDQIEPSDARLWELFHENSKTSPHQPMRSNEDILERMESMSQSLAYQNYPIVKLPESRTPMERSFGEVLESRVSSRGLEPVTIPLETLGTLLYSTYGVTRDNRGTDFPRPFRIIPSGGALYPLEIYVHTTRTEGLGEGLYHYNPPENHLRRLVDEDLSLQISKSLVQDEIAYGASALFFITAMFERSAFKYGNRGYRFILLEAGHAAQNLNLAARAMGLGCLNVGGYFDRGIDRILGIDGVTHSTVYMVAVAGEKSD